MNPDFFFLDFRKLGIGIFFKMNSDFWIFGNLEREFLKNESGFFWIFENLEREFLENESGRSSGDAHGKKCESTNFVPIDTLRYPLCLIYNVKAKVELR